MSNKDELLVECQGLTKLFPVRRSFFRRSRDFVHAVEGVSFGIRKQECLALVGESGSGKTTVCKLLLRLISPTSGKVLFEGENIFELSGGEMRNVRVKMQMVFQDPADSLNPRKSVRQILSKPFKLNTKLKSDEIESKIIELLQTVGLTPAEEYIDRLPHEFSGGQKQRIDIARAIALRPKLVVADEPVSALDVSVRGQILNLMKELQGKFGITYLFVTHDLAVVRSISQRVGVMYLGRLVEIAPTSKIFSKPLHPYTQSLLSATPIPDPKKSRTRKRIILKGEIPSRIHPPSGCRFHTRCPYAQEKCKVVEPELVEAEEDRLVACHFPLS